MIFYLFRLCQYLHTILINHHKKLLLVRFIIFCYILVRVKEILIWGDKKEKKWILLVKGWILTPDKEINKKRRSEVTFKVKLYSIVFHVNFMNNYSNSSLRRSHVTFLEEGIIRFNYKQVTNSQPDLMFIFMIMIKLCTRWCFMVKSFNLTFILSSSYNFLLLLFVWFCWFQNDNNDVFGRYEKWENVNVCLLKHLSHDMKVFQFDVIFIPKFI
jgi:hypothetical protein